MDPNPAASPPPPAPADPPPDRPTQRLLLATAVFLLGLVAVTNQAAMNTPSFKEALGYLLAPLFGLAVGATELAARYRDRPLNALRNGPAHLYVAVNAAAALAAVWLLLTGRLSLGLTLFGAHPVLNALTLGGFGAMALFRTSLFTVKVADTSVSIGPAAVLQVILRLTDREVDRLQAGPRAADVSKIMRGVVYDRARDTLPLHCWALMQNVTLAEQNDIEQALSVLDRRASMSDEAKAYSLGLLLMNLVGKDVLERAVGGLGERIKGPPPDMPMVLGQAKDLSPADLPALVDLCQALNGTEGEDAGSLLRPPTGAAVDNDRVVIVLARLRRRYGAETLEEALHHLLGGRTLPGDSTPNRDAAAFVAKPAPSPVPPTAAPPGPDGAPQDASPP